MLLCIEEIKASLRNIKTKNIATNYTNLHELNTVIFNL